MSADRIVVERDVEIPFRDGLVIRADVYRPDGTTARPALLQYTAYSKANWVSVYGVISPVRAAGEGFAVVVADAAGRYRSDGDGPYRPFADDGAGAAACIDWIAAQPWCDGGVGMYGASNSGVPQWQVLRHGSPALRAIAPHMTASELDQGWVWRGGAFHLGFNLWWTVANLAPDAIARARRSGVDVAAAEQRLAELSRDPDAAFAADPDEVLGPLAELVPHYRDWRMSPPGHPRWAATSVAGTWPELDVPVLHVAGWYNVHLDGNLRNWEAARRHAPPEVGDRQHLIIGPWTQWLPALGDACGPERRFPTAPFDMEGTQLAWFAHHLGGGPEPGLPRARVFVMGADEWWDLDDWPPPGAVPVRYHLAAGGALTTGSPAAESSPDTFRYDPVSPVPTVGGATMLPIPAASAGQRDQRAVAARDDVLCYATEPLTEPVTALGPVTVELFVTSDAPSVDLTAKLVDIGPDGAAMILTEGITRAALPPGEPAATTIDLLATGNVFALGHRIGIEVAASNFPKYDRHPGNAGSTQTVLHDATHPSALILSVVEPGTLEAGR